MYWFTADEHYGHFNIIKHCDRPFKTTEEMNDTLIANHNKWVKKNDVTIHAGDFCWDIKPQYAKKYIKKLNGSHIFLKGSHDRWMNNSYKYQWRKMIYNQFIVVGHYPFRTWERSHHGSWNLHGHSHGKLVQWPNQYDVGVDNNNFYPVCINMLMTGFFSHMTPVEEHQTLEERLDELKKYGPYRGKD